MSWDLSPGDQAPEFTALDEYERQVSLQDFEGSKVVLFFYVEDDGNADVAMVRGFREQYPALKELGAVVIGVGPGTSDSHAAFKEKRLLPFTLMVDEASRIARSYGAYGERMVMGSQVSSPIRSHFIIAEDGMVIAAARKVGATDSAKMALRSLSRFTS